MAAASERATVFQTWEWGNVWWRHYGGRGRRFLGLVFVDGGNVIGIAPFWRDPLTPELRGIGDGASDYLDIIAHPEHETSVVRGLLEWLVGDGRFCRLDIRQARPGGVLAALIEDAEQAVPRSRATLICGETCPFLPLASSWDAFKKTLGKKMRSNIGYYERNLEKHFVSVSYQIADTETLTEDLEAFFALHQRRWNERWLPGAFASAGPRRFHTDIAKAMLAGGFLRLHTLTLDGRTEAALYCFHKHRTTYYYLGGFEPEMARFSIGTVLTAKAIRHALETDDATEFDFLRGNEAYKYKWGSQDRHNSWLLAGRRGLALPVAVLQARATIATEMRLKQWMHARFGGAGNVKNGAKEQHG